MRFQPTKRPHPHPSKLKSKTFQQKFSTSVPIPGTDAADIPITATRPSSKTTLADWTAQADEKDAHGSYEPEKRQRGGRKRRKKNKEPSQVPQNWDGIYDPSRPNTYDDYKHSEERILELREWKDRLYAHRVVRMQNSDSDDSGDNHRFEFKSPSCNSLWRLFVDIDIDQSALPGLSFAPPTFEESDISQHRPQVVKVQNDPTGRDAYPRRKHMSEPSVQATFGNPSPTENESIAASHQPSSPPSYQEILETAETLTSAPSISRAPVRYNLPVPPPEIPASEAELKSALGLNEFEGETGSDASPRSLRPGQKGFAQRLMSRYGWSKGSGLGVSGSGILDPLLVQIEKQRKKPDSEGGGFTGPGGRGKIVGGQKKDGVSSKTQEGRFGIMSEVVILFGMVDGMNIEAELEGSGQGGLIQEIGEECTEKVRLSSSTIFPDEGVTKTVWSSRKSFHRPKQHHSSLRLCQIYQSAISFKGEYSKIIVSVR